MTLKVGNKTVIEIRYGSISGPILYKSDLVVFDSTSTNISDGVFPYITLDYAYNAEPLLNIAASGNTVLDKTNQGNLDYAYNAEPFYPNNLILLNS